MSIVCVRPRLNEGWAPSQHYLVQIGQGRTTFRPRDYIPRSALCSRSVQECDNHTGSLPGTPSPPPPPPFSKM